MFLFFLQSKQDFFALFDTIDEVSGLIDEMWVLGIVSSINIF